MKFNEEKEKMKQGKEQMLVEKLEVKEAVKRELCSMTILEIKEEDRVTQQVDQLAEAIQQLQQCIEDLVLCTVLDTPWDVRDEREETSQSAVEKIKDISIGCKKLSGHSDQMYEKLTKNPELKALESQLQEAKYQAETIQSKLMPLSAMERMKRSQEKCTIEQ
jgi:hypothetical protein